MRQRDQSAGRGRTERPRIAFLLQTGNSAVKLRIGCTYSVGTNADCDVVLPRGTAAGHQAYLTVEPSYVVLRVSGTECITAVSDGQVHETAPLRPNDQIRFGLSDGRWTLVVVRDD